MMPSSRDSEKHLAVTCDFNVSIVTGDVSPKTWALECWHLCNLIDSASIHKLPLWVGTSRMSWGAHPLSSGRRSRAILRDHSGHL